MGHGLARLPGEIARADGPALLVEGNLAAEEDHVGAFEAVLVGQMHVPVPQGSRPGMAARQVPAVLAQHGHHLDFDLLAFAGKARNGNPGRRRPRLLEMGGAGQRRGLEIRHRAMADIPAVHLHHVVEGGAEMRQRLAELAHHLLGLADDVAGEDKLSGAVDGRLGADEDHLAAAKSRSEALGQERQARGRRMLRASGRLSSPSMA